MDCNSKLFLEFSLLKEIMLKEKQTLKFRLDHDDEFLKDTEDLNRTTFGEMLYTLTKDLNKKELLDMSDQDMIKHIQVLQIKERQ